MYIPFYLLLILFVFIPACQGQNGTQTPKNIEFKVSWDAPKPDPYFIESRDTVSPYGPQSITRNMLEDRNGNMWLATWQGLIRYDGKVFTNFTHQAGLKPFHGFSLLMDKNGNLWFGTIGAGAYFYDGKSFRLFSEQEGLVNNRVTCLLEDATGNIWFGTSGGACYYDGKTFTHFTTEKGLPHNSINTMVQDKNGKIWLGTDGGACYYDGTSFISFMNQVGLPFHNVRSIIEDKKGNLWFGSADGLCRYDGRLFTTFTTNFVGYVFEDRAGNIWTSMGEPGTPNMSLYRYDVNLLHFGDKGTEIIKQNGQNDFQVFGIFEDKEGDIWFGTMQGAVRYDGKAFHHFRE